jgi:hypothetical protein
LANTLDAVITTTQPKGLLVNEKERNLRELHSAHFQTMTKIMEKMDKGERLTAEEGLDFDNANRGMQYAEAGLKAMGVNPDAAPGASAEDIAAADGRGLGNKNVTRGNVPEIQGTPGEKLCRGAVNAGIRAPRGREWRQ